MSILRDLSKARKLVLRFKPPLRLLLGGNSAVVSAVKEWLEKRLAHMASHMHAGMRRHICRILVAIGLAHFGITIWDASPPTMHTRGDQAVPLDVQAPWHNQQLPPPPSHKNNSLSWRAKRHRAGLEADETVVACYCQIILAGFSFQEETRATVLKAGREALLEVCSCGQWVTHCPDTFFAACFDLPGWHVWFASFGAPWTMTPVSIHIYVLIYIYRFDATKVWYQACMY